MRISPRLYTHCTTVALVFLGIIIVSGAAVRLSGSGLGCPDWPTCANGQIVAPAETHAMIEFINRVFTGAVSIAVMATVLGSLLRSPRRRDLTYWSLGLVAGVFAQILIGGAVVLLDLDPIAVIAHFAVSMVLLWNAIVLRYKSTLPDTANASNGTFSAPPQGKFDWRGIALVGLMAFVLAAGTLVTSSGPHAGDETARRMNFALNDIARIHSVAVWVLLAATLWLALSPSTPRAPKTTLRLLIVAILAQGAIGYYQYFNGLPAFAVGLHVAGSAVLWCIVCWTALQYRQPTINLATPPSNENTVDVATL